MAYAALSLYNPVSTQLTGIMLRPMLFGIPLGAVTVKELDPEAFRSICMSFDACVIGYGLSKVIADTQLLSGAIAFSKIFPLVVAVNGPSYADSWSQVTKVGRKSIPHKGVLVG